MEQTFFIEKNRFNSMSKYTKKTICGKGWFKECVNQELAKFKVK